MIEKQQLGPKQLAWVEALESGKYEQGNGYLRTLDNKFCCLGVLLDTLGYDFEVDEYSYTFDGSRAFIDHKIRFEIKMHTLSDSILMRMNDNRGFSFEEIAAAIREEPKKYFYEVI